MKSLLTSVAFALFLIAGCADSARENHQPVETLITNSAATANSLDPAWKAYWYAGNAELSHFKLEQSRYGEMREARAVLIFVTEDFSRSKHVKLDDPDNAGDDKVSVLKLNAMKTFNTGIYDYSIMQSVFTPVDDLYLPSLKATCSVQDWCGQAFSQVNQTETGYRYRLFSYFEHEGDQDLNWGETLLEDEIWARIRMTPGNIPKGLINMVPNMAYMRLSHLPAQPYEARIKVTEDTETVTLSINYTEIDRVLDIFYKKEFPHYITGWKEQGSFEYGQAKRKYVNRAELENRIKLPYWEHNRVQDSTLRKQFLGLVPDTVQVVDTVKVVDTVRVKK